MTTDNTQVVQPTEPVSPVEPVSPTAETLPEPAKPAEPQPLTAEAVQQMIAEATARAVAEAKELGRRELQGEQDRNKAELARAQRRAQVAESTLGTARRQLQSADPETAKEFELAELRAERQGRMTMEQEEAMMRQQAEFHQQFHTNLTQFITGLGVDPNDQRIDWAGDASNYLDAQQRVLDSVSKIQKENIQATQSGLEKRLKELEAKVGESTTEANSVDTTTPQVVAGSDAEFIKLWGSGELPSTKENFERAQKIQSQYE